MFKPKSIVFFLLFILLIVTSCKKKEDSILNLTFQIPEVKDTFKYSVPEYLFLIQESMGDTKTTQTIYIIVTFSNLISLARKYKLFSQDLMLFIEIIMMD